MILARVDGIVVTTVSHESLRGCRTVICQPLDGDGRVEGELVVAIDPHSAGLHQRVVISTDGSATRAYVKDPKSPLRHMIVAIVDDAAPDHGTTDY